VVLADVYSGHRLARRSILRPGDSGLRAGHQQVRFGQAKEGVVRQCRPEIQGRQEPEFAATRGYIEKITHVYRNRLSVPKYSCDVPVEELEREEFNLNIRRYVDNSPPPEPHDVRSHLHGGIPVSEITLLSSYFAN
jgi:hypothetical protein